ncbi:unnamed protein product [Caretta caretta]
MIWVAVIGDWFNLIFKWILFGHRPYWWVQETMIYSNQSSPCLEQFPITCETGPGSPSGHAMGSSCVWYVMVTAALSYTVRWKDESTITLHRLTWSFLWSVFWIIQISVCVSRVFIATHFPHQVILGVIGGMLVAEAFEHTPAIQTASLRTYIKTNLFLFIFALGFYLLLKLIDVDLLWSVPKAKKWCANPDWINIDTTPFAGLVRNLGALFGLGLGINSEMFIMSCKDSRFDIHASQEQEPNNSSVPSATGPPVLVQRNHSMDEITDQMPQVCLLRVWDHALACMQNQVLVPKQVINFLRM